MQKKSEAVGDETPARSNEAARFIAGMRGSAHCQVLCHRSDIRYQYCTHIRFLAFSSRPVLILDCLQNSLLFIHNMARLDFDCYICKQPGYSQVTVLSAVGHKAGWPLRSVRLGTKSTMTPCSMSRFDQHQLHTARGRRVWDHAAR